MRTVLIFLLLCTPALAHDSGHPELDEWFNRLKSGEGLCCSFADGFAVSDVASCRAVWAMAVFGRHMTARKANMQRRPSWSRAAAIRDLARHPPPGSCR